jgi:hypothetical protein
MAKHILAGGIDISDDDFTEEELALIYGTARKGTGVPGQQIEEENDEGE